jgi:hypothetical protein
LFPNMRVVLHRCSHSHYKGAPGIWNPCLLGIFPRGQGEEDGCDAVMNGVT